MAQTLRQYELAQRSRCIRDGVPGQEYDRHYPRGCEWRRKEWVEDTLAEARRGVVLPVPVLDQLVLMEPWTLADLRRDYRVTLPEDYEHPEVRKTPSYRRWLRWTRKRRAQLSAPSDELVLQTS